MNLQKVEFLISAASPKDFPAKRLPEIAFAGKSNVGKSSVINRLLNRKNFARVGEKPGKTIHVNYFTVDKACYFVDLPGYGYARVSKSKRGEFSKIILDYVLKCEKMHFLFVLVDSRLEPQKIDLKFIELLGENGIPFGIIFTKTDKLSQAQLNRSIAAYKKTLAEMWEELPPMLTSSSEKGSGREEILTFIEECLANY